MDEIFKNIYSYSNPFASDPTATFTVTTIAVVNSVAVVAGGGGGRDVVPSKTVNEVWIEIVAGSGGGGGSRETEMTLEHSAPTAATPTLISAPYILLPEIEMVVRGLEKYFKLDQREFLMNSFPPVCGDEARRSVVVALGLVSLVISLVSPQIELDCGGGGFLEAVG
ncbi:hypothetical protein T459_06558 [Capsicum annuum]|uniref:Uncharacterized protein n=1 Tax=Capsicum annuum TaxID=4072 RepID=A0A2G3AB51_CAPAN|nr:hypothetical protein T459_06558 [Capsicum annuum]